MAISRNRFRFFAAGICMILMLGGRSAQAQDKVGEVIYTEGDHVFLSAQRTNRLRRGTRLEIRNYDGKTVATVGVESLSNTEVDCKIIRGRDDIREGFAGYTRSDLKWGLTFESISFPLTVEPNDEYTAITQSVSDRTADIGQSLGIGAIFKPSNSFWKNGGVPFLSGLQLQLTTAYVNVGQFKMWEIFNVGPAFRIEFVPERFRLEVGGGFGLGVPLEDVEWARPDSVYSDSIPRNSGRAHVPMVLTYRGWIGFHYQMSRPFGIFARLAWYDFNIVTDYTDTEAPTETNAEGNSEVQSGWEIQQNWLESNITEKGGPTLQAGVQIWFAG